MKIFSLSVALCGTLFLGFCPARAQQVLRPDDDWMFKVIPTPKNTLPIDQALAALSRDGSMNLFLDATAISPTTQVQPFAKFRQFASMESVRSDVFDSISSQAHLTYGRPAIDTIVFWPQPDLHRTINLIAARQRQLNALYPPAEEGATVTALQEFLARTQGWNMNPVTLEDKQQRTKGAAKSVALADLPPELRASVQAEFVRHLRLSQVAADYNQLELPSWKDARIRYERENYNIYNSVGLVTSQEKVYVLRVYFPGSPIHAFIGASHEANPHQVELANFSLPSWASEGEHLSRFKSDDITPAATSPNVLPEIDWDAQADLQKNVKFSAKRVALRDLVADLSQQTGVALSVAPDVAPKAQVWACSSHMRAADAMAALERLYSARWVKMDQGFAFQSQGLDEVHETLARWGYWTFFDHDINPFYGRDAVTGAHVADEVAGAFDRNQLLSKEGAPFSELPLDVQSHVLQLFREDQARTLLVTQQQLEDGLKYINDFSIRLSSLPAKTPRLFNSIDRTPDTGFLSPKTAGFGAYTPDGRFITPLFNSFVINPPNKMDEDFEKMRQQVVALQAQRTKEQENQGEQEP